MRLTASILSLCTAAFFTQVFAADSPSQGARTLSAERNNVGSSNYRETVDRFLRKLEPKIIGGQPALAGAFPWQVSLTVSWIADPYRAHFCGGTVYSPTWIVTAAHCVDENEPRDIVVIAGTHVLGNGHGTRHNVERIITRFDYNKPIAMDNDIALIQLREPLTLGPSIRAIPIVTAAEEPSLIGRGSSLTVTGWGATREGGNAVRDLRYLEIPYVDRSTCNRPLAYDGAISNNMICAGVEAGGQDSCQGDSGGPLTVSTQTDPKLAGVVSWGDGCAQANRVGVYTRAANYATWVASCVISPDACQ